MNCSCFENVKYDIQEFLLRHLFNLEYFGQKFRNINRMLSYKFAAFSFLCEVVNDTYQWVNIVYQLHSLNHNLHILRYIVKGSLCRIVRIRTWVRDVGSIRIVKVHCQLSLLSLPWFTVYLSWIQQACSEATETESLHPNSSPLTSFHTHTHNTTYLRV